MFTSPSADKQACSAPRPCTRERPLLFYGALVMSCRPRPLLRGHALVAHMRRKEDGWSRCAAVWPLRHPTGGGGAQDRRVGRRRGPRLSSGMAALTATLLTFLGGRPLYPHRGLLSQDAPILLEFMRRIGVSCSVVAWATTRRWRRHHAADAPDPGRAPRIPTRVADLSRIAAIARQHDILTLIDATFATPTTCAR